MRGSERRSTPSTSPALTATMRAQHLRQARGEAGLDLFGEDLGEADLRVARGPDRGEALLEAVVGGLRRGAALVTTFEPSRLVRV